MRVYELLVWFYWFLLLSNKAHFTSKIEKKCISSLYLIHLNLNIMTGTTFSIGLSWLKVLYCDSTSNRPNDKTSALAWVMEPLVKNQSWRGWVDGTNPHGPFYENRLTGYYIHYKVWAAIIHPFPNFNSGTVDFWEWMSKFIPHFFGHMIRSPCRDWS